MTKEIMTDEGKNRLEEKVLYCFIVSLRKTNGMGNFCVPFKVIAGDIYEAQAILEEWLQNPEQTRYKYQYCEGITRDASESVITIKKEV